MESAHPFSVSFAPCCQAILCRSQLFFRMFLDKLFQICADRFIMKQKRRCFSPFLLSPSSRRAWIEIQNRRHRAGEHRVALLAEGVDRNRSLTRREQRQEASPSSRRAWIEISGCPRSRWWRFVALLAEGVDRNPTSTTTALSAGWSPSSRRAWIEMTSLTGRRTRASPSPSSRRAWIEIEGCRGRLPSAPVALLAEGVDRNTHDLLDLCAVSLSPSSRRAWIEIESGQPRK